MKSIQILTSSEQIEEACELLHAVYVDKMNWNFSLDNPAGIRIEIRGGRKLLIDNFTNRATWFGVYNNEKLVACTRIQGVDDENLLELERYPNSHIIRQHFADFKNSCVELLKFAVHPGQTMPGVVNNLFLDVFRYCQQEGKSVILCTNNNFLKNYFLRIKIPLIMERAFKYEEQDPQPVNFYFAHHERSDLIKIISVLEKFVKTNHVKKVPKIFNALEIAAPVLPIPVYWHDKTGAVLGLNERCLKGMGTSREIIGKTPYDFYQEKTADYILSHNKLVMDTEQVLAQEEKINDITTGQVKYFSSIKAPLYDEEGKVIGIVGASLDITAEKESEWLRRENEKLEIENRFQNKLIQEQKNFKKIIDQAVHDIRSPLASLMIMSKYTKSIPEDFCSVIIGASKRINNIANNLLEKYKHKNRLYSLKNKKSENREVLQVSLALYEIITEKKYEFYNLPVEVKISIGEMGYSAFIFAEEEAFKRMISNLINNAVEAFDNKSNIILVKLDSSNSQVNICIEDNGKGMPPRVIEKITHDVPVTVGKKGGHGIGFVQVKETLRRHKGSLAIKSQPGEGTSITVSLPKIATPTWIAENVFFNHEDTVLVLDDDPSIYRVWQIRFREKFPHICVKHFEHGEAVLNFLKDLSDLEMEKYLLLADYELLYQDLNGLEVIEKSKLKRAILVTSHYSNHEIIEQLKKTNIKLLPKLFISEIPITIN